MTSDSVLVRQRVAEALARAGLHEKSVAAEVLLMLPSDFLTWYEQLFLETWSGSSGSIRIGDENAEQPTALKWRTSSGQTETRGTASKKGHGSTSKGLGVRNVRAAATKEWADRKLRAMAREIRARLSEECDDPVRRCTGPKCRKIAESRWNYCPYCGAPTEDEE